MTLSLEEIFLNLVLENEFQTLYDSENKLSTPKEKALEELNDLIGSCAKKAGYWALEGDPYGFLAFKGHSKNFIKLLQFIKNDDIEEAIDLVSDLSTFERKMLPLSVVELLEAEK